jgi:hypothetical protein
MISVVRIEICKLAKSKDIKEKKILNMFIMANITISHIFNIKRIQKSFIALRH